MDIMPLHVIILQSLPESAIIVALGLVLIGVKPRLLPLLAVAFIAAVAAYFIRALPLAPGVNILLQLPIIILLIKYLLKIPFTFAMLASFLGLICVTLTEIMFNTCISAITGISVQEAITHPLWRLLFPLPEFAFLTGLIILLNYYEKSIFNFQEISEMEQVKYNEE